jgi:cell division septation protein DedD
MEMTGQERVAEKRSAEFKISASMESESPSELIKDRPIEEIQERLLKKKEAHQNQFSENTTLGDGGFFTIQLASLTEKEKAQKMIDRLIYLGYPAYYYDVQVKGKTYYRVRCGRFKKRNEAAAYAVRLEGDAGIKGFISRTE